MFCDSLFMIGIKNDLLLVAQEVMAFKTCLSDKEEIMNYK